ncbi:type 1 glutamine amidotransferase [Burkholderiaceae bacterium UC74_6]
MNPVALLQHEASQGPGYLMEFLHGQGIPSVVFQASRRDLPLRARDCSGIVVLGSNACANDDHLPWVAEELRLLEQAVAQDVPVLGHCFGAQLLARALGASVTRNAWPNIGWSRQSVTPTARHLFGGETQVELFNWHYDTFEIPKGATRTLFGMHCLNKGFMKGPHLGLQSHLEVTEHSVRAWCEESRHEFANARGPAAQSEAEILRALPERTARLHRLACCVYRQWLGGLARAQERLASAR